MAFAGNCLLWRIRRNLVLRKEKEIIIEIYRSVKIERPDGMVRFRLAFPSAGVLKSSGSGNGGWRNLLRCCSSHENRREDEEKSIYSENLGTSHRLSEFQSLTAVCLNFGQTAFSVDTRGVASLLYCQHKEQISFRGTGNSRA